MCVTLENITAKVNSIAKRNPVYTEIIQWVGDLLSATVTASKNFQPPELDLGQDRLPAAWYQGKSLFDPEKLDLDWQAAGVLYQELAALVKDSKDGPKQVEGLLRVMDGNEDNPSELFGAVLISDEKAIEIVAGKLEIDPAVLMLLLRLSLRPALRDVARAVEGRLDLDRWHYGHCPVCGSAPRLADLSGEGGQRTLHCSLCETIWPYVRLRCPFCENDNKEDLSYLRAESEEGLRVDLCRRCGQYLKTIDLRELAGPIIVALDDAATLHLDLIAKENLKDKKTSTS